MKKIRLLAIAFIALLAVQSCTSEQEMERLNSTEENNPTSTTSSKFIIGGNNNFEGNGDRIKYSFTIGYESGTTFYEMTQIRNFYINSVGEEFLPASSSSRGGFNEKWIIYIDEPTPPIPPHLPPCSECYEEIYGSEDDLLGSLKNKIFVITYFEIL
jgi:hypothetical protein